MSNNSSQSIAIAGGGLLGRLLAWRLLREGFAIKLYEAGALSPSPAAAFTAAGMISPLSEAVVSDSSVYQMGLFALEQWPRWLAQFSVSEMAQSLFSRRGSLVIAHPQDAGELNQFTQELRYVLPQADGYRAVNQAEIRVLEPDLNTIFQQGLLLEDEGHIDNRRLLELLLVEITQLGGILVEHSPVQVKAHSIISADGEEKFNLVLDCRGTGAKTQNSAVRGVRGETMHVQTREVHLQRPVRLMHPRYQLYIVPKPDHCFIIGATQIESEDRSPISLQSSLELSSALYTLSPAFAEARVIETGVNLRPAFMDNMPQIHVQAGLISANGLFRHGFLLAPAVVTQVVALVLHETETPFDKLLARNRHDYT